MVFFVPSVFQFDVCRQVGFFERCFLDAYSLALEIQRIASIRNPFLGFKVQTRSSKIPNLNIKTMIHFGFLSFGFCF